MVPLMDGDATAAVAVGDSIPDDDDDGDMACQWVTVMATMPHVTIKRATAPLATRRRLLLVERSWLMFMKDLYYWAVLLTLR
mmetsp:Transcript_40704/g.73405  ORF Transcript_40704/g.73405 Transcript_40704/m.73405 type:complete len:82 (+) Transcript_40704:337-582(+)